MAWDVEGTTETLACGVGVRADQKQARLGEVEDTGNFGVFAKFHPDASLSDTPYPLCFSCSFCARSSCVVQGCCVYEKRLSNQLSF